MKFEGGLYATNYQSTTTYGLGTVSGDSHTYATMTAVDANKHVQVSYEDALGRTRYIQTDSGLNGGTLTANMQQAIQYNALDKSVSLVVTDLALSISATTTASYDDLGRMTSLADPDRGTHTYTYDADGRQLTDVSGTRTIGTSYDLLGRIGCLQDAAPTTDGSGTCSSGSHPLVQNTYDVTKLGTSTTDFPLGQLTQSVATTYYNLPTNTNGTTVTEQFQHDQRGQLTASTLQISVPSGWNVTTPLPTYGETQAYNDANQPMTTQTTVGGSTGYTFSQAYDSTTGQLTGLSNNSTGVANLATLGFNAQGLVSDLNFQTTTGTALANDHFGYDNDLRPQSSTATWQSGSGSTGTIFSNGLTYDPVGNMTSASTTHAAVPGKTGSGGSEAQNFCYNEQNRLVWAGNSGSQPAAGNGTCGSATLSSSLNGASYNSAFVYTNLGQISQAPLNGIGAAQYYLYCNSSQPHQLTGVYPTATTCANATGATYSASYDSWGNMTSRSYAGVTATLTYDVLDHLVKWDAGTTNKAFYAYDASGNRVLLRSTTSSTTITTYPFGLEEHTYGNAGANKSNTYYYTLDNRLIGELTGTTTLSTQFFLTDTLGSVLATFNATAGSAAVLGNQIYGPYGNQRYNAGTMGTAKGYTGQYADPDGLDYYNARYYDPVVGVFLSADTVQDNLHGFGPYMYVGGNPETRNDPTGYCPWCVILGAVAAYIVAGALTGAITGVGVYVVSGLWQGTGVTEQGIAHAAIEGAIIGAIFGPGLAPPAVAVGQLFFDQWLSDNVYPTVDNFLKDHNVFLPPTGTAHAPGPKPNTPIALPSQPISVPPQRNGTSSSPIPNYPGGYTASTGSQSLIGYYTVRSGDSLWAISSRFYGSGFQWQRIYQANRGVIGSNPNLIYAGERLAIFR